MMKSSEKTTSYAHILKYAGVFGGVQGLNILIGLVRNKLVALLLGPSGMGLASIFNSTVKLISDSTNMGVSMTATREIAEAFASEDTGRIANGISTVRSWSFLTALFGLLVCFAMSPLLDSWTFNWGDHTLHYMLLSPVVALTAITGGELSILKGTRRLRQLALVSVYGVIGSVLTTIPLYYIWGETAIVPSLIVVAVIQMCLTIRVSYQHYPLRLSFSHRALKSGSTMVRLGMAFMLAGVFGSASEFVIRLLINTQGSLELVGLYNVGYMMAMVYAGMIFSAMETDYFPRLSSFPEVGTEFCLTVNRQMEVMLLLAAPMLTSLIVLAPVLLPLLFSAKFMPVLPMLKLLLLAMYFRALILPMEYINLARGKSKWYMLLEVAYDVMITLGVAVGFTTHGLVGAGVAWLTVMIINAIYISVFCRWVYSFKLSFGVVKLFVSQFLLGIIAFLLSFWTRDWCYWLFGILLLVVSWILSLVFLRDKVSLKDVPFVSKLLRRN